MALKKEDNIIFVWVFLVPFMIKEAVGIFLETKYYNLNMVMQ